MSGAHTHALYFHGHSPVHGLSAHVKIVALFGYVGAVVATPTMAMWAFGIHAAILMVGVGIAEIPAGFFFRRLSIEIPFVIFALAMPFVGTGPTVTLGPLSLSVVGLWGAWNVLAKATLCVGASVILSSTTEVADILSGFDRLRAPRLLTAIAGFMIRYVEVVTAELGRVRIAIAARLGDLRRRREAATLATVSGTMFIRSFERGERIHHAMLARGFTGTMPMMYGAPVASTQWGVVAMWAGAAWTVTVAAMMVT